MALIPETLFKNSPPLIIAGKAVQSESDCAIAVLNPSNGSTLSHIPTGSGADVEKAVSAASAAFKSGAWSGVSPMERKKILHRFADLITKEAEQFDLIDAYEMGKPISTWRFNAAAAADHLRFYAEATDKLVGKVLPTDAYSYHALRLAPRGVVGAITPWNFPTYNALMKLAPALAAGNSVVLKPSEISSFSALRLAQLSLEAGIPAGVVNIILGHGHIVGKALALHPGVDMITFTGSTGVGKLMMQYAGLSNMKKVLAECGGKCPQIVFDDGADLEAAADFIALYLLTNQGQVCSAGTRLLVQRSVEHRLLDKLKSRFSAVKPGDAVDPKTTFGPLVSRPQLEKVMDFIEFAPEDGAEVYVGGKRILPKSGGNFVEPTIFRNVSPTAAIAQEEIFGPVLAVTAFDTEEEAINLVNGTRYALNAYLWTANLGAAMRMVQAIRSTVSVRSGASKGKGPGHAGTGEPTGDSGLGAEGGIVGIESYMRHHSVGIFY